MERQLADRGPRAEAGGGHKKECPAPCSGPIAAALSLLHFPGPAPGPVAGAAVPVRGMGVGAGGQRFPHVWRTVAMAPEREPVDPGPRGRQGSKGRRPWRTREERGLPVTGAWW
jgi:hypothetical protein